MKIHLNTAPGNLIKSCDDNGIVIGETRHEHSLILTPDDIIDQWRESPLTEPDAAYLAAAAERTGKGAIALLGMGKTSPAFNAVWHEPFIRQQTALETMSLRAACRTYNILAGDGRPVVAMLILPAAPQP